MKLSISPIHEAILTWSTERPLWQKDALRRLVEKKSLDDSDIDDLVLICKSECNLLKDGDNTPSAVPLTRDHLPVVAEENQAVTLNSVSDVKHVNALPDNQTLTFGKEGLTIIYGDNGSGKTGYSRILKRVCRARNQGNKITPNIHKPAPNKPAQASITYCTGDTERTTTWIDNQTTLTELSAISFFDSDCAIVHVEETNDTAFTPFGLDLLEKLAEVCNKVKSKLEEYKVQIDRDMPVSLRTPKYKPHTQVGKAVSKLTRNTNFLQLKSLGTHNRAEQDRQKQIKQDLASDPTKAAAYTKERRLRIEWLQATISTNSGILSEANVERIRDFNMECKDKEEAAIIASTTLFADEPLTNIGSKAWRNLWEAARRYSNEETYSNEIFPFIGDKARCVLCQQELKSDAQGRLRSFEDFVKEEATTAAQNARQILQKAKQEIENTALRATKYRPILNELSLESQVVADSVRRAIVTLRCRRRTTLEALKSGRWASVNNFADFATEDLELIIKGLKDREQQLQESANPEKRKELESELQELEDRMWLSTILDDVKYEIRRLEQLHEIGNAIRATRTNEITNKNKVLSEEHVTNQGCTPHFM